MVGETKILVVDDDEAVRDSLKLLLESLGMQVEAYASTDDFLRGYRPHDLECLILDQHLQGGKTGLDFVASEMGAVMRPSVILVTGRGDDDLRAKAYRAGVSGYLEKPIDPDRLIAAIDEAIAARR
jgi:two-component system, LuxR family, response regulator FixJ